MSFRFLFKKRPIYGWKWLKTEKCSRILIKFGEDNILPYQNQTPANLITGLVSRIGRSVNLLELTPNSFLLYLQNATLLK